MLSDESKGDDSDGDDGDQGHHEWRQRHWKKTPLLAGIAHRGPTFAFAGRKKVPFLAGGHRRKYPIDSMLVVVPGIRLKKDAGAASAPWRGQAGGRGRMVGVWVVNSGYCR